MQDQVSNLLSYVGIATTFVLGISALAIAWAGFIQPNRFRKVTREIERRLNDKLKDLDLKTIDLDFKTTKAMYRVADEKNYEKFIYSIRYAFLFHQHKTPGLKDRLETALKDFDKVENKELFKTFDGLSTLKSQIHQMELNEDPIIQNLAAQLVLKFYSIL